MRQVLGQENAHQQQGNLLPEPQKQPLRPVIASGGFKIERIEILKPERSGPPRGNPLPKTEGAKTRHVSIPTILPESYLGYPRGIAARRTASLRFQNLRFALF
jgi:hypothetical protein